MAKTTKIRDWTLRDVGENRVTLTKGDRLPMTIEYDPGMAREVLIEFATTRALEGELQEAGVTFERDGTMHGLDQVPAPLRRDYERHVATSRVLQGQRESMRRIAEEFGGEDDE